MSRGEKDLFMTTDTTDSFDMLDGTYFLVGMLDGNQNGLIGYGISKVVKVHEALPIHIQIGHLKALSFQRLCAVKHREIFDLRHNYVFAFLLTKGQCHSFEGNVRGLGASRSENKLFGGST
jgi:hypothetical protein